MVSPKSRRWVFTTNNYTPEDEVLFKSIPCRYLVFGKEVGAKGTPHLQGFVIFEGTKTLVAVRKLHGATNWLPATKSSESASNYCKKGEQSKSEWEDFHNEGPNFGLNFDGFEKGEFPNKPGKRNDLDEIKEAIEGGMVNPRDLRKHHSSAYSRHKRFVSEYILDNKPNIPLKAFPLRPWMEELNGILINEPDDREIIFVVDPKGNAGKSWFVEHFRQLHPRNTIVCLPGKKADMVYSAQSYGFDPRCVFLDAPRSKQSEFILYDFLEEMKNGCILNTKYESNLWRFPRPHVVVMMNEQPDMSKLTDDRYHVIRIRAN